MRISFDGDGVLDTDARQVFRGRREVVLSPMAYELLRLLVDARPKALAKEQLYKQLWPETFVVEGNLPNLIKEIRAGLGDAARQPRIIRTLHRFGYAFSCEATIESASGRPGAESAAWLNANARVLSLRVGDNVIGRSATASVRLDADGVSRRHAIIHIASDDSAAIEDLGSKNGTFVRGQRVTSRCTLLSGDEIRFGSVDVTFHTNSSPSSTVTIPTTLET
jgi:DNA-binding winged helix-turn-helix (wHTH) protein